MTRVLVVGAGGRMGAHLLHAIEAADGLSAGAALDRPGHPALGAEMAPGVTLDSDLPGALARCDVAIDFSIPASTLALIAAAAARGMPVVTGTTGVGATDQARIAAASEKIAIVQAGNFSVGITVLLDLVAEAARRLEGYDLEVLEMHHSRKMDAPSGTALALARSAAAARGLDLSEQAVYHREGHTGERPSGAIGMQTLRMGDIVGEHTVYLAGPGERVELSHVAQSRDNFAAGAVRAARWILARRPGLYSMRDVLSAER